MTSFEPEYPSNASSNEPNPLDKLRSWQRFHIKLMGLYGGAVLLALAIVSFIFFNIGVHNEKEALQKRLLALVTSLASSIDAERIDSIPVDSKILTPFHEELLARLKKVAANDPEVATIYILRPTNEPTKLRFLIDYVKNGRHGEPGEEYDATDVPVMLRGFAAPAVENQLYTDEFGTTLSGYAPVVLPNGRSVALVGADVKALLIEKMQKNVLLTTLGVFGGAFVVILLITYLVARNVREPLSQIIRAASAVSRGELDTHIGMQRSDEFGIMSRQFDVMTEGLREREFLRETFGRYMSEDVARTLLDRHNRPKLGGEERVVTVLFIDLRGYSTVSERLPPAQVVEMLNQYMGAMNTLIDAHRGCAIEFIGDAILAVFGAPIYISDHAEQAVLCAMQMRERLVQLNEEWKATDLARFWKGTDINQISARIGIHSGRVVAGNLGSPSRMKYAVIGDTVNVAARLENLNKEFDTDILISEEVYAHLPEELSTIAVDKGECKVKGRDQMVRVYAL